MPLARSLIFMHSKEQFWPKRAANLYVVQLGAAKHLSTNRQHLESTVLGPGHVGRYTQRIDTTYGFVNILISIISNLSSLASQSYFTSLTNPAVLITASTHLVLTYYSSIQRNCI